MSRDTSWGREADERWNGFRDAVRAGAEPQQAARDAGLDAEPVERVHVTFSQPHPDHGTWTSPPSCLESLAVARAHVAAITALAGPDAASRRVWSFKPCDGRCRR